MDTVTIDYTTLLYIIVGLFAVVGFFRGWLKEGITTVFLVLLTMMFTNPEMTKVIIGYINNIIKLFWIIVETRGRLEAEVLSRMAKTVKPPLRLDPENPQLYVGAVIFLVILSYMTGKITFGGEGLTAASRLMGGILGSFNGYLVVSLTREYALGFFLHPQVQIEDMPQQSLLQGYFLVFVMVGGLIVFLLILATSLRLQSPLATSLKMQSPIRSVQPRQMTPSGLMTLWLKSPIYRIWQRTKREGRNLELFLFSPRGLAISPRQLLVSSLMCAIGILLLYFILILVFTVFIEFLRPDLVNFILLSMPVPFVIVFIRTILNSWRNPAFRMWIEKIDGVYHNVRRFRRDNSKKALREYENSLKIYLEISYGLAHIRPTEQYCWFFRRYFRYGILGILQRIAHVETKRAYHDIAMLSAAIAEKNDEKDEIKRLYDFVANVIIEALTLILIDDERVPIYTVVTSVSENSLQAININNVVQRIKTTSSQEYLRLIEIFYAYILLFEKTESAWEEALQIFEKYQHLKYGQEVLLFYRSLSEFNKLSSIQEIINIDLDAFKSNEWSEIFLEESVSIVRQLGDIAGTLATVEQLRLPDKLPYYSFALEKLDQVESNVNRIYGPGRRMLQEISSGWRFITIQRIKELKGRAELNLDLVARKFPTSVDRVSPILTIENDGTSVAENVMAIIDMSAIRQKVVPSITEVNLGFISPAERKQAEFRLKPLQKASLRIPFVVTFDDLEKKGKKVEFADTIEFYEEEKLERFAKLDPNPYVTGRPLHTGDIFVGREDVFDFIQQNLKGRYQNNIIVLYGQRRTGKTSILYQLLERLGDDYVPVLVDMHGIKPGTDYFFYETAFLIVEALKGKDIFIDEPDRDDFEKEPEGYFGNRFLRQVRRNIGERHLLLMIDEFEVIEENIRRGLSDARLLYYLRHLMQHSSNLDFIFVGAHKIEEMAGDYWSVFFNLALYKKISFLDEMAAEQLITQPVEGYFKYDPLALNKIKQITGRHPYFIQLLCRKLVDYRNKRRLNYINVQHVNDVIEAVVEEGEINIAYIWRGSRLAEKLFLVALNELIRLEGAASVADVNKFLQRRNIIIEIFEVAKSLKARDVILEQQGRYEFAIELFRYWIEENYNLEKTLQEASHDERESLLSPKGH